MGIRAGKTEGDSPIQHTQTVTGYIKCSAEQQFQVIIKEADLLATPNNAVRVIQQVMMRLEPERLENVRDLVRTKPTFT